jgi:hypothetical protein
MTTISLTMEDIELLERLLVHFYSMSRMSVNQENHVRSGQLIDEIQQARIKLTKRTAAKNK